MVNYQNAKIYKIVNDELNLTYYGSTCSTLTKRLSQHKCEKRCKSKLLFSTETKPEIFLVEKFPCNNKIELLQRERFYIENNECVNLQRKQYRIDNEEKIKLQRKQIRIEQRREFYLYLKKLLEC